jgi:SAM-dependent methyltransferase
MPRWGMKIRFTDVRDRERKYGGLLTESDVYRDDMEESMNVGDGMGGDEINKTMDRGDLGRAECAVVLEELFKLMGRMEARQAVYSSWYGRAGGWPSVWEFVNRGEDYEPWAGNPDELRVPWFLLWEICWLVANTPMKAGGRVLDMGGAGSLFSCFLASRGYEVYAIDLQEDLCSRANETAGIMGWNLKGQQMDMRKLEFPDGYFDHVFSVCVFEHLPVWGRVECIKSVERVLRVGGTASYTFDYGDPQSFGRIDTPEGVRRQFIAPSKLVVRGNPVFYDNGQRYLEAPQCFGFGRFMRYAARLHSLVKGSVQRSRALRGDTKYTFGALFMEKERKEF